MAPSTRRALQAIAGLAHLCRRRVARPAMARDGRPPADLVTMRLSESPLKVLGRICVELRRNDGDSFASATACFERDTALGLCDVVLGCDGAVDARRQERVEESRRRRARGWRRRATARRELAGAAPRADAWERAARWARRWRGTASRRWLKTGTRRRARGWRRRATARRLCTVLFLLLLL